MRDYREEFWKGLKELKDEIRTLTRELAELQRETDRRMRETDREIKEIFKELAKLQRETDKQLKETDRMIKETDRQLKELSLEVKNTTRAISELNGVWKSYSEKIMFDNIEDALKNAGFQDFAISKGIKRRKGDKEIEIDFLAVGDGYVVVLETKTTLKVKDVRKFVKKLKDKFLEFFPEFRNYRIYGAVVGINLQDGVEKFAFKNGLMVFRYKDNGEVEILNPEGFEPKDFGVG